MAPTRVGFWTWIGWDRKWLFDFNAGKTQLVSFNPSHNSGVVGLKMDESSSKKSSFKVYVYTFIKSYTWVTTT